MRQIIILLYYHTHIIISMSILLEELEESEKIEGIPVCGANLSSPVMDTAYALKRSIIK